MPIEFELHQPKYDGPDPDRWELGLRESVDRAPEPVELQEGRPGWHECSPEKLEGIERLCRERLLESNPLRQGEPYPEALAACEATNRTECVTVVTEGDELYNADGWLHARACIESSCSEWSTPTPVPEPGFMGSEVILALVVLGLAVGLNKILGPR